MNEEYKKIIIEEGKDALKKCLNGAPMTRDELLLIKVGNDLSQVKVSPVKRIVDEVTQAGQYIQPVVKSIQPVLPLIQLLMGGK